MHRFPLFSSRVISLILCLLIFASFGFAQTSKGTIAGTVTDSTGAAVVGATVDAVSKDTGESRSVTTGSTGTFRIDAVNPGVYKVKIAQKGFSTLSIDALNVLGSVVTPVDAKLKVGATETSVSVEAQSNSIQTENGQIAGNLNTQEITSLPISNLNPISLILTQPGVVDVGGRKFGNGTGFSVNGSRTRSNNFLIDGQDNNDNSIQGQALQPQNSNAVQEVTILQNAYSAEFGRGGGSVTNVIFKSGTNKFHGSGWELFDASSLNALTGSEIRAGYTGRDKARYDEHTLGFTFGGPIIRNKLFFFGSAQWQKYYGNETATTIAVPTEAGIAALKQINTPNALKLVKYYGNLRGDAVNGTRQVQNPGDGLPQVEFGSFLRKTAQNSPTRELNFKVDYLASEKDNFAFRVIRSDSSLTPDFFTNYTVLPGFDTTQGGPSENFGLTWTHSFSPKVVNEFRFSYGHFNFMFDNLAETKANPLAKDPTFTISGLTSSPTFGINTNFPQGRGHSTYQGQDSVTLSSGNHIWKFGADIAKLVVHDYVSLNTVGTVAYAGGGTDTLGVAYTGFGNFIGDFLGSSGSATITFGNHDQRPIVYQTAYFAQDTWKLQSNLTIDLGVRYEYQQNPENYLKYPGIDMRNPFGTFPGTDKVKDDKNNFAPRIGFAYTPHVLRSIFGDGKTVLRGGYGMFYDSFFTNILINSAQASPNAIAPLFSSPGGHGTANASGLIATLSPVLNPTASVTSVDVNLRNPLTHQWNFNIQRELPGNFLLTAAYVGNRGIRLFENDQLNPRGGWATVNSTYKPRLNATRGSVLVRDNGGSSIYHGMNLTLERRFSKSLMLRSAYTWGKMIDNGSEVFATTGGTYYSQNMDPVIGRKQERGLSAYDVRQRWVSTYVWDLPKLKTGNSFTRVLGGITNGWQLSGTYTMQSGLPQTFYTGQFDLNGDGTATNDRPSLGNANMPLTAVGVDGVFMGGTAGVLYDYQKYLKLTAGNPKLGIAKVPAATALTQSVTNQGLVHFIIAPGNGNVGRNTYILPGSIGMDTAVTRQFKIPHFESHSLQVRAELYNPFNHKNLNGSSYSCNTTGSTFLDQSQGLNGGRTVKFQAKYVF